MKYNVLTQNSIYSLSSDYIKHMYPSDKMYKSASLYQMKMLKNCGLMKVI